MNMDVVSDIFPDLLEVHRTFFNTCQATLSGKLTSFLHDHLAQAGFVIDPEVETLEHEPDDVSRNLASELGVWLQDPLTGSRLRAVAYVESSIADEDTFALDTTMGLSLSRVNGGNGNLFPKIETLAYLETVAYGAKPHHDEAQHAFKELASFDVNALFEVAQSELVH